MGDKAQAAILESARLNGYSAFEVCERIARGQGGVSVGPVQKKAIAKFVELIQNGQKKAQEVSFIVIPELDRDAS